MISGRARLDGGDLLAEGRFAFWGDAAGSLCRADFMGPDGRPLVSLAGDSTGMTVYMPRDERAWYSPGGIPLGGGVLGVRDLLFFTRTGLLLETGQSDIVDGAEPFERGSRWLYLAGKDTLAATLEGRDLFPKTIEWAEGRIEILGTTPHDEYEAWPGRWSVETPEQKVFLEITRIETEAEPWPGLWTMTIPSSVLIDTLQAGPAISPLWKRMIR
ncbi:hypothetical protein GX411_06590 [Candidatus Fermentibacteria bacterium]|nr:hypothetical protein [Candidatus Fermentibacteria bacterium]